MKRFRFLYYPLIVVILVKIMFSFGFFQSLEYKAQDSLFRLRGAKPVSNDIVIVAIDDNSFQALNTTWPFSRDLHAKLIDNLSKAGAKQIVFDIEFLEQSDPMADMNLASTAAMHQNTIFAGKVLINDKDPEHVQKQTPMQDIVDLDIPWGIVNMSADADGFIRRYTCYEMFDKSPVYTIGVASIANSRVYQSSYSDFVKLSGNRLSVADKVIPLSFKNKCYLNYYGPAKTFTHYSYSSVIDDSATVMPGYQGIELDEFYGLLDAGVFRDKTVLVGATIDELHDQFPTPFSKTYTDGVEIHANFIEMVKNDDYLYALNPYLFLLIELLLLVGLWFAFKYFKPQLGAILLLVLIVGHYFLSSYLFSANYLQIPIFQAIVALILIYMISLVSHYIDTLREKRFIRSAFQQYMAPELVNELLKNPKSLTYGGSQQELSVLFSDIRSFTTYSESHKPDETVQILKEYLTDMVNIIIRNKGILDKFVGDEIMALFGTPVKLENHALSACRVALEMREHMTQLHSKWKSEGREIFEIGIGINTGFAVVGNLGSEQIFDYTAIGDTINLGARLEAINKEYETKNKIIISEFTLAHVQDLVEVNYLDEVKVKGKNNAVKIYELISIK